MRRHVPPSEAAVDYAICDSRNAGGVWYMHRLCCEAVEARGCSVGRFVEARCLTRGDLRSDTLVVCYSQSLSSEQGMVVTKSPERRSFAAPYKTCVRWVADKASLTYEAKRGVKTVPLASIQSIETVPTRPGQVCVRYAHNRRGTPRDSGSGAEGADGPKGLWFQMPNRKETEILLGALRSLHEKFRGGGTSN